MMKEIYRNLVFIYFCHNYSLSFLNIIKRYLFIVTSINSNNNIYFKCCYHYCYLINCNY